jgi:protein TonB
VRHSNRNLFIGGSVVLFHAAALWGLQSGLLRRTVELVVPVEILSELVTPPQPPKVEPAPPPPRPEPPPPVPPRVVKKVERVPPPAPQPLAVREAPAAPNAPTGATTPQPPAPPIAAPVAPVPAPPAAPRIELPTSDADYLQNPKPPYPATSKRLGEQGKVVVRVFIGADGVPQQAEVRQSSGYERLDQAARATAMKWRYVSGKRGGVPEAMWVNVPINFVLE